MAPGAACTTSCAPGARTRGADQALAAAHLGRHALGSSTAPFVTFQLPRTGRPGPAGLGGGEAGRREGRSLGGQRGRAGPRSLKGRPRRVPSRRRDRAISRLSARRPGLPHQ